MTPEITSAPPLFKCVQINPDQSIINHRSTVQLEKPPNTFRMCFISDTHNKHKNLSCLPCDVDVLFHTGDVQINTCENMAEFTTWLHSLGIKQIVIIGGNHDRYLEQLGPKAVNLAFNIEKSQTTVTYLYNSGINVCGVNVFGSPISNGVSKNKAFQSQTVKNEAVEAIKTYGEVDILLTHSNDCAELVELANPTLAHAYGHVHSEYGVKLGDKYVAINASMKHDFTKTMNAPIIMDLDQSTRDHGN